MISPTAADNGAEGLPAEQSAVGACGASPSLEALIRDAHGRLAELLQMASSILTELCHLTAAAKEGAVESSGQSDSAAISQRARKSTTLPTLAAAILLLAQMVELAKLEVELSSPMGIPSLHR
ncbi:unnamed protein product [Lampetra fluviatilis]